MPWSRNPPASPPSWSDFSTSVTEKFLSADRRSAAVRPVRPPPTIRIFFGADIRWFCIINKAAGQAELPAYQKLLLVWKDNPGAVAENPERPAFDFFVDAPDVFAKDAEADQLDTAQK